MTRLKWARKAVRAKNAKSNFMQRKFPVPSTSKTKIKDLQQGLWNQCWHLVNDKVCIVSTKVLAICVVPVGKKDSFKNKC